MEKRWEYRPVLKLYHQRPRQSLRKRLLSCSVADPDAGSVAFLPPGSGIRDGAMVGSGSGIRDKQTKFVNSLYTKRGRIRDPVLFYSPDPGSGSGMEQWSDPGSGISKQNLLIAFIQKEVGSGIRCFFTPRIRDPDPGWSNDRIRDKTSLIRNTTLFLCFPIVIIVNVGKTLYYLQKLLFNNGGVDIASFIGTIRCRVQTRQVACQC
jgi:hypothetical protein